MRLAMTAPRQQRTPRTIRRRRVGRRFAKNPTANTIAIGTVSAASMTSADGCTAPSAGVGMQSAQNAALRRDTYHCPRAVASNAAGDRDRKQRDRCHERICAHAGDQGERISRECRGGDTGGDQHWMAIPEDGAGLASTRPRGQTAHEMTMRHAFDATTTDCARCLCDECDECMPAARDRRTLPPPSLQEGRYVPRRCRTGIDDESRRRQMERIVERLREEVGCRHREREGPKRHQARHRHRPRREAPTARRERETGARARRRG